MKALNVRGLTIGVGAPKICVSITGSNNEEIVRQARSIFNSPAELVEWRCDFYHYAFDSDAVLKMLHTLREILGQKAFLFTFRTKGEGGQQDISETAYNAILGLVIHSGVIDIVDVELRFEDVIPALRKEADKNGVYLLLSYHNFDETPSAGVIESKLRKMQRSGADIAKVAVMPRNMGDVLVLLVASEEMFRKHAKIPLVTIAMGDAGKISRICGSLFGSTITFATLDQAVAPGQMIIGDVIKGQNIIVDIL